MKQERPLVKQWLNNGELGCVDYVDRDPLRSCRTQFNTEASRFDQSTKDPIQ